jgi:hypothetical protein
MDFLVAWLTFAHRMVNTALKHAVLGMTQKITSLSSSAIITAERDGYLELAEVDFASLLSRTVYQLSHRRVQTPLARREI